MEKLNEAQVGQLLEVSKNVSSEFRKLVQEHMTIVTSEELDYQLEQAIESTNCDNEYMNYQYDLNFASVAIEYCYTDKDIFKRHFGHYGQSTLYMDELGRGLVIEFY